jgi:hypothetical protein
MNWAICDVTLQYISSSLFHIIYAQRIPCSVHFFSVGIVFLMKCSSVGAVVSAAFLPED